MARYREMKLSGVVGHGVAAFDSASAAVLSLRMHREAGVKMTMPTSRVRVGDVIRLRFGLGPLAVSGSCDVIMVVDEPRRRGFSYRTRPDHPEEGEEGFYVNWAADDQVLVNIESRSRPNSLLIKLGGPVSRLGQLLINRRYVSKLKQIVAAETPG
jgi:uncharacterized protein (UPF0548 family)